MHFFFFLTRQTPPANAGVGGGLLNTLGRRDEESTCCTDFSNLLREKGRGVSLPQQQFNMEFYLWVSNMGVVIIILAPQHELIFSFSSFSSTFALPCVQKLSCFCFNFFFF